MSALMADDFDDIFRIRPGRPRSRGGSGKLGGTSFRRQVEMAVRKAGGDPRRIGRSAGRGSGRFNARGRGAKLAASLPRENAGWKRYEGGMRFRSRRVVVKTRVVKLNAGRGGRSGRSFVTSAKAVDAHLRYLERDGVTRDGEKGRVYSAYQDEADGKAFVERGREDRHQFRFIVAPEDAAELHDLRGFTRDLMRQMEDDLDTRLDWVAIDHHNTGHPHTHILVRGVTDDGKILNIAGDYIAHGIRHRASERLTLELGPQSELEVAEKLAREVDADRLTRLDRMLIAEQRDHDLIDLNPNASDSFTIRANRYLLIDRVRKLERMGLAEEIDTGQWSLSDRAERTLKDLGMRNDIIKTMHRALTAHDLAEERSPGSFEMHGQTIKEPIIGRVLAKGLAGDEMSDRLHVVVDGIDGRIHYVETADAAKLNDIGKGHIVALEPVQAKTEPRPADINIRDAADDNGLYRPSRHRELARAKIERMGGDPDAFIRSHVRRLEALRRAGYVERIDDDHWRVPPDLPERGIGYDARSRGKDVTIRTLSAVDLEAQIGSDGATWLDRELASADKTRLAPRGFGREVTQALDKRAFRLVEMGLATHDAESRTITFPRGMRRTLERQEIARVGREMAKSRERMFTTMDIGDEARGKLVGAANLVSGRYAMLDDGHQLHLVPWEPMLEKRIGQTISAHIRTTGGIEWSFGRQRGIGIDM
ncbi:DUF3363 domain-containing protein [Nitratireductor luteus]|uniref:DUF3363 domain-containing protein n=1 Tax=Nitratireductor luteus TaxID=2976980 RepID=UPI00224082A7|nr:DUF3363 domain-containing protein [Nitratireductor luteus]